MEPDSNQAQDKKLLIFMESMIEVLKAEMQDKKEKQAGSANKT